MLKQRVNQSIWSIDLQTVVVQKTATKICYRLTKVNSIPFFSRSGVQMNIDCNALIY